MILESFLFILIKNVFHTNTIEENIPNKNTSSRIIVK